MNTAVFENLGTTKQHKAAKLFAENILKGNTESTGKILRRAGYSPTTADKAPVTVTKSPTFRRLLEQYLPLEKVVDRHSELLDDEESSIRLKAVELGYKAHGVIEKQGIGSSHVILGIGWKGHPLAAERQPIDVEVSETSGQTQEPGSETLENVST